MPKSSDEREATVALVNPYRAPRSDGQSNAEPQVRREESDADGDVLKALRVAGTMMLIAGSVGALVWLARTTFYHVVLRTSWATLAPALAMAVPPVWMAFGAASIFRLYSAVRFSIRYPT